MTARQVKHISMFLLCRIKVPIMPASFMTIYREELDMFFSLLTMDPIKQLLEKDKCCNHFKRSGLSLSEYAVEKFWLCLYLAHDQEEDEEELKWELLPWALGEEWMTWFSQFSTEKLKLWKKMGCRSVVSKKQCEQIMTISSYSTAWGRVRREEHGGAIRRG